MWEWAGQQARAEEEGAVVGKKMFRPLVNLWRDYPELKDALTAR